MNFLFLLFSFLQLASSSVCEDSNEDCPVCENFNGNININAIVLISPNFSVDFPVLKADLQIAQLGKAIFDPPFFGLHMTIGYFCCQTVSSMKIIIKTLQKYPKENLKVELDSFGCNYGKNVTYLHAMPKDQEPLFNLIRSIESDVIKAGGTINHKRSTNFHCTLARAALNYPVEEIISLMEGKSFGSFMIYSGQSIFVPQFLNKTISAPRLSMVLPQTTDMKVIRHGVVYACLITITTFATLVTINKILV